VSLFDGLINIGTADGVEHYTTASLGVSAGDTISFVVGRGNGSFTSDSTGLAAVIDFTASATAVPEPGTGVLVGLALGVLAAARRMRSSD